MTAKTKWRKYVRSVTLMVVKVDIAEQRNWNFYGTSLYENCHGYTDSSAFWEDTESSDESAWSSVKE